MFSAGFMLRQNLNGMENMKFGIGFKGTYTKVANSKHIALPINAELSYTLPLDIAVPITLSGSIAYAPSVLTFEDANKYFEGRAEISAQIIEQGSLFIGYRQIDTNFKNADYEFSNTGYIGFKVRF